MRPIRSLREWGKDIVEVLLDAPVATLVADHPNGNAIDRRFIASLRRALRKARALDARAAVIVGIGEVFSSGLPAARGGETDPRRVARLMNGFSSLLAEMLDAPMPLVGAVNGHAIGGGCLLALACDHLVMARGEGRIGLNDVTWGLCLPSRALALVVDRVPRAAWSDLVLRGRLIDAEEAHDVGLVHQAVEPFLLLQSATAVARELAARPPAQLAVARQALNGPLVARLRPPPLS